MAALTPSCWFQDCGAPTDMYDEFVEGKGVDKDSQAYDSGDDAAEVAGWLTGISGLVKTLMKKLVKKGEKKAAKEAEVPSPSCTKCFQGGRLREGTV